ncbi:PREDICTED: uncharacterized protein LOC104611823 [Nelumbo nucifera]|uniref:Uncharacterized protein LOC104611823 n=1 Tax=Nelumbo nucifera TaxID=4432 RepID=A0A1U8B8D5_NELNU|nr:PREDICTED: uncharacterized protein LOC104611823 [Nelumbo nucifera]
MIKLEPIPSFSLYDRNGNEIEDEEELATNTGDDGDGFSLPPLGSHYANRSEENETFGLSESLFCQEPRYLCLALGLGVDPDRAETKKSTFSDERTQQHYQNLLHDDPCNPLILRNYATYLNKVKGDYEKAEKLYSRAILANPNDGEVLSEYAKLRWKVHGDQERASNYFERAVKASPQNR